MNLASQEKSKDTESAISRRKFLQTSGSGIAITPVFGVLGGIWDFLGINSDKKKLDKATDEHKKLRRQSSSRTSRQTPESPRASSNQSNGKNSSKLVKKLKSGEYFFNPRERGDRIIIENRTKYAKHLEYGTYEFGGQFTEDTFPSSPLPKKKDISPKARKAFPRGAQPFAIMRRVLYNKATVTRIIKSVLSQ